MRRDSLHVAHALRLLGPRLVVLRRKVVRVVEAYLTVRNQVALIVRLPEFICHDRRAEARRLITDQIFGYRVAVHIIERQVVEASLIAAWGNLVLFVLQVLVGQVAEKVRLRRDTPEGLLTNVLLIIAAARCNILS